MQTQTQTESPPRVQDVEATLRRQGFTQQGYPAHVAPMTRAVDQSTCRRMKCPSCGCRMKGSKAFHKVGGAGGYKLLANCASCDCAEEV